VSWLTAAELGIKKGQRHKLDLRYVEVLDVSPCGRFVRVLKLASKKREWVRAEHLGPAQK
jgi:hypothetical protein